MVIRRVRDEDAKLLRYLKMRGLTPGTAIEFVTQEPFEGAFVLNIGGKLIRLTSHAGQQVFVEAVDGAL